MTFIILNLVWFRIFHLDVRVVKFSCSWSTKIDIFSVDSARTGRKQVEGTREALQAARAQPEKDFAERTKA